MLDHTRCPGSPRCPPWPTLSTGHPRPQGPGLCLNVFPSRGPYRLCSAAFPVATRRAPVGSRAGRPAQTSPLTRAGRFSSLSGQGAVSAHGGPARRTLLPTLSSDSNDGGEPSSHRQSSALGTRNSEGFCLCSKGGQPQRFPEPSGPTVAAAQPPTSRLALSWGSRAGCPASTTPLTRAGQPPGGNQEPPPKAERRRGEGGPGGARAETERAPRGLRRVSHRLGQQWFEPLACLASALRPSPSGRSAHPSPCELLLH